MRSLKAAMTRHRGTRANRTKSGGPSATARRKYGAKSGPLKKGSFPVFDTKSGKSALNLRGRSPSKKAVVNRVSSFANRTGNATLKAAVKRARAVDAKGRK